MVGKLDLNLGEHYAYDIRRAKQVAEGRDILADSLVIDGGAIPITGSALGEAYDMSWDADGTPVSVTHTLIGTETKPETLEALAALALADASVLAEESNNEVVLLVGNAVSLTNGLISRNTGQIGGGLPPGGQAGPYSSAHGDDFWIKRSGGAGMVWSVGWDINSNPGPDAWNTMMAFNADAGWSQDYKDDVNARAQSLGWPG